MLLHRDAKTLYREATSPFVETRLAAFLKPDLTPPERLLAEVEGWILGVSGQVRGRP
jgi:hypothetical protein